MDPGQFSTYLLCILNWKNTWPVPWLYPGSFTHSSFIINCNVSTEKSPLLNKMGCGVGSRGETSQFLLFKNKSSFWWTIKAAVISLSHLQVPPLPCFFPSLSSMSFLMAKKEKQRRKWDRDGQIKCNLNSFGKKNKTFQMCWGCYFFTTDQNWLQEDV